MNFTNFRTPTQQERKLAVEVAEAFGLEYSELTNLQLKIIYCMIKAERYDHRIMLDTIQNHKDSMKMFWVMTEYAKSYEVQHGKTVIGDKL
jgi:hypothetical protein